MRRPMIGALVRKLPEVEEAKELMMEAERWSVFTWLFEKRRVREMADFANAALDKLNHSVKTHWNEELKAAYRELASKGHASRRYAGVDIVSIAPEIRLFVEKVKEADEAARRARMTAEETFDEAEKRLDTDLAREGCRQAIRSWELHEKAIRRAESVPVLAKQPV
jgi:hypothetical protein